MAVDDLVVMIGARASAVITLTQFLQYSSPACEGLIIINLAIVSTEKIHQVPGNLKLSQLSLLNLSDPNSMYTYFCLT